MLGYTVEDIYRMMAAINIAYEIIDGPVEVETGLMNASNFLEGLLVEGHIQ
jgi:hypothetical protein